MAVTLANHKNNYGSNIVKSDTLAKYQISVLDFLRASLEKSFGPYGSNTCIKKTDGLNMYTKDGYTILSNIKFTGIIEESIRSDIESITNNIANTVGDGTTSAVILSYYLLKDILTGALKENNYPASDIISAMHKVVDEIKQGILNSAKEATIEDIYDIALISANNNVEVATMIRDIYEELGMGVFIDVAMTTNNETSIKFFDGMTLNTGYSDSAFVNDRIKNTCTVDNPVIYFFEDAIDTRELGVFFDSILSHNILEPIRAKDMSKLVPTVIVAPKVSRDMSSLLDSLVNLQANQSEGNKLPVLIVTNTHQVEELMDICKMCGAKPIHKYIDREIYQHDVEEGLAPTPETAFLWGGHAEQVIASSTKTKFITPEYMKDSEGNYTVIYNNLMDFLQTSLDTAISDGDDAATIGRLRRRINSLKSNLVEVHVGGITVADRDSVRHLVEDAVKNCRSAAINGVGWAANFNGYIESITIKDIDNNYSAVYNAVKACVANSYANLVNDLYKASFPDDVERKNLIMKSITNGYPINLRTKKFDGKAKSSIESDVIILESVSKIVTIMATCNQFLTPNPQMNIYSDLVEVD